MTLRDCINRTVAAGDMDLARATQILRSYDNNFAEFQRSMGQTQAEIAAARQTVIEASAAAKEKRRIIQLTDAAKTNQLQAMLMHQNMLGQRHPGNHLTSMLANVDGAGQATVYGQYRAIRATARGQLTALITATRARVIPKVQMDGLVPSLTARRRDLELVNDVRRAIFNEDATRPEAAGIADNWRRVSEELRTRSNAAGTHIPSLKEWGLPQRHDARAVRKAGYDAWRAAILYRADGSLGLDLEGMGTRWNNGLPFTETSFEPLLRDVFEVVRTEGRSQREPSSRFGAAMYNRKSEARFFKFKTSEDWARYDSAFGSGGDVLSVMLGHIDNMAMDIAAMERLGPNPENMLRFLSDAAETIEARGADVDGPDRARKSAATAQVMYDTMMGRGDIPHNKTFAAVGSAVRNFATSNYLGTAVISSLTDFNMGRVTSQMAGMGNTAPIRMMARILADPKLRAELSEARLVLENGVDIGGAVARYEMEDMQFTSAAALADMTIRASGLGWLTEAQRHSFGGAAMRSMVDWKQSNWADLNSRARKTFLRYGISEQDWGLIQTAEVYDMRGLPVVRPQEIEAVAGQGLADRYLEMIQGLTDFAVPSTEPFSRALVTGSTQRGTIGGEMIRFGLQFKGFAITLLMTHVRRMIAEGAAGNVGTAAGYFGSFVIGNTILGGLAIQLKELAKGNDPQDMTDPVFWGRAFMQGGGVGIFGDFLLADQNRFGGGMAETIGGPGISLASDVMELTVGNVQDGFDNGGRDVVDFLRRNTPGGSLFYLRLAYEREVLDQVQRIVDGDAARVFRNRENAQVSRAGNQSFVAPGASVIQGRGTVRAPDFGAAIGR